MASLNQPGARVAYLVDSANELPDDVRQWLSQADKNACASPDIYDILAILSRGQKLTAIIIDIQAVDWNELDFFNLALRLNPETHIYVTGNEHQQEKIEAACNRGARLFNKDMLKEDRGSVPKGSSGPG